MAKKKKILSYGLPLLLELDAIKQNKKRKRSIQGRRYFIEDILIRGIYKLFHNDTVVYVGQSKTNVLERISRHHKEGAKDFDSFTIQEYSNKTDYELSQLEKVLIEKFWPKYNIIHNK